MSDIQKVISVCSAKDLSVWSVTATYLTKFIDSKQYTVIVPEQDLNAFKNRTPNRIEVVCENIYTDSIQKLLKPKFNEENKGRYGWYLQQLIKLSVLREAEESDTYLIWDADTVPLKPLNFSCGDGLKYYKASEHHLPYFEMIHRLLGLEKITPHSFVAQCFPAKGEWLRDFFLFVEQRNNMPWLESIIQATDFHQVSGFSEYETLGTFFTHKYGSNIFFSENKWLRRGNSLIGAAENLTNSDAKSMLDSFDYVAFERSDRPSRNRRARLALRRLFDTIIGSKLNLRKHIK